MDLELKPAEYVVLIFGGVRILGRAIGRQPSAISQWFTRGGGQIPKGAMIPIITAALRLNLDISTNDLLFGRTITRERYSDLLSGDGRFLK